MFDLFARAIALFYQVTHSFGLAIILLTVLVRLLMFPLTAKQARSMQAMQQVQPEIKRLQQKYKDDRQKLNEELMKFYRENKINPAAGCLPLLIQMPIFFVLFRVIRGLTHADELNWLGIRVPRPQYLSADSELYQALVKAGGQMKSLGVDLAQSPAQAVKSGLGHGLPFLGLVALVAITGLYQQRQSAARAKGQAQTPQAQQMQTILKVMPVIFAFVAFNMQAGLVVYFVVSNLWTIGQQAVIFKQLGPLSPSAETVIEVTGREKGKAALEKPVPAPKTTAKGYTPPRSAQGSAGRDESGKKGVKPPGPSRTSGTPSGAGQSQRKKKGK